MSVPIIRCRGQCVIEAAFAADNGASAVKYPCLTTAKANMHSWMKAGKYFCGFVSSPVLFFLRLNAMYLV